MRPEDTTGTRPPPAAHRRLYRRTDDKVVAGVASGLGDYFSVDPVLFRIGFVALTFAGGFGLLLYLVGWIVMPPSAGGPSAGEDVLRRVRGGPAWLAVVLLVIGAGILVNQLGVHRPDLIWGGVLIFLGVLLFRHATTGHEPTAAAPPPAVAPEPPPPQEGTAPFVAPPASTAVIAPPAPSFARRRDRSMLGWGTVGFVLLGVGVAVILDDTGAFSLSLSQYLALALSILAAGLVVGAWIGRARWLVVPALLLVPAIVMSGLVHVPIEGGFGDRSYHPGNVFVATSRPYRLIAGRMDLDLSDVATTRPSATVTASIVAGELHVVVPRDTTLVVHAEVGAGELHLFGRLSDGLKIERTATVVRAGPDVLRLELAVSFGRIFVDRW